ncbi:hypothetical protein [Neobacillus drentensis]|uniref:hypothetical protein n=1 Tax=Neobacillus drentensis TaxID=220684 RepID=UPI000A8D64BC|nr:hypothetical protein [Neobacillus drentensis]
MKIITSQKYQVMNNYLHIFGHLSCFLTLVSTLFYVDTDVKEKPRRCQQIVQQVIGRWMGDELDQTSLSFVEKEVLRLAIRKGEAISPVEVEKCLKLSDKTVKKVLSKLVDKKMLIPASGSVRIGSYRLGEQVKHPI